MQTKMKYTTAIQIIYNDINYEIHAIMQIKMESTTTIQIIYKNMQSLYIS